jgi:hypothetical protein
MSGNPPKGRPASEATPKNSSKKGQNHQATNRQVTPASTKRHAKKSAPPLEITKRIPRKSATTNTTKTAIEISEDSPPPSPKSTSYDSPISENLLATDEEDEEESESPQLNQSSSNDYFYGRSRCASLTTLFEREAKSAAARKSTKATPKKPSTATSTSNTISPSERYAMAATARKGTPANLRTPTQATKESEAVASAQTEAQANEPPIEDSKAPAADEKSFGSEITASQEDALVAAHEITEKAKQRQKKQPKEHLPAPSSSTARRTTPDDLTVKGNQSSIQLPSPFQSASTANTDAPAQPIGKATAKVQPTITDESVKAHERKLKHQAKTWKKADTAVNKETFFQVTAKAFETHTNSTLITNLIVDLTSKLHQLTNKVIDYQAKATKFEDLPHWIPKSCKSSFTLSAPQDIPDDDTGLTTLREKVATIQHSYETALRDCVCSKEMLLLNTAMKERREEFVSKSLDIATYWLCLWLPKNQNLFKHHPQTIKEDQVVGIVFERFLTGNPSDLLQELNYYFNAELNFLYMLPASIRSQPRFRSEEEPEKRIFRNRKEAAAATMYPFTKVTWGHDDYGKLEAAIRIIEPFLVSFLSTLCAETTFKFQQAYEAELNQQLAELKVEARQKKQAAFSAASETGKALAAAKNSANESVKVTIDKLQNQISQLQRTQQRQSEKLKTAKTLTPNKPQPKQKNLHGSRGKGPSAVPTAFKRDKGSDKPPPTPPNRRSPNNNKRKATTTNHSADDSASLKKKQKQQKQKQYKRKKLLTKQRQQKLTANTDKPVDVQPPDVPATSNEDSSKS